jgi:pyruvate dehydrogenase E1 component
MSIAVEPDTDAALRAVEERVLWLATAIVDHANRVGRTRTGSRSAATRRPAPRW